MSAVALAAPPGVVESVSFDDLERHLPLVQHVLFQVASHFPRHADFDELSGAGALGLVEAAMRFDPTHGVPFERWAMQQIRGRILDAARAADFAPKRVRSAGRALEAVTEDLTARLGRVPTDAETSADLGVSPRELSALRAKVHRSLVVSLDAAPVTYDDGDGVSFAETVVDADLTPLETLERRELDVYVRDAVQTLPERLRGVVEGYFLHGTSSADLAAQLGVTESRVSQLRSEALRMLREGIRAQYDEIADRTTTGHAGGPGEPAPRGGYRKAAYAAAIGAASTFASRVSAPSPATRLAL